MIRMEFSYECEGIGRDSDRRFRGKAAQCTCERPCVRPIMRHRLHWPASGIGAVSQILPGQGNFSKFALAKAIDALAVQLKKNPANIDTPTGLAEVEETHDL